MGCCDNCGSPGVKVQEYEDGLPPRKMLLCDLCAGSFAGPDGFFNRDTRRVTATICFVGNAILKTIAKRQSRRADF